MQFGSLKIRISGHVLEFKNDTSTISYFLY